MTPYYEQDGITIYHGDCRDVLSGLPPSSVDLVLSDPPYGMAFVNFSRDKDNAKWSGRENVKGDGVRQGMRLVRAMLIEAGPIMAEDAHLYLFCHWEAWPDFYDSASTYVPMRGALIWQKNTHGPGNFAMDYQRDYEVVLYGARGARPLLGGFDSSILKFKTVRCAEKEHPTEKPVELFSYLVGRSCPVDGTVIDPFMGCGTTLVAAKVLGRKAIGIELEEKYCEIAAKRLAQGALPLEMVG